MEICSNGHEEIVFKCRNCPLCEKVAECRELEEKINDMILEAKEEYPE